MIHHKLLFGIMPVLIIIFTFIIGIFLFSLPDLNDPFADFITIGTSWSSKSQQFEALLDQTFDKPVELIYSDFKWIIDSNKTSNLSTMSTNNLVSKSIERFERSYYFDAQQLSLESRFCLDSKNLFGTLWERYASNGRLIVSIDQQIGWKLSSFSSSQFNLQKNFTFLNNFDALHSLCQLELRISRLSSYHKFCSNIYSNGSTGQCCSIWSLPSLIALMFGKVSCNELSIGDMIEADDLLQNCSSAVFNGFLSRSCWDKFHTDPRLNCPLVKPERCLKSPMIPLILATLLPDRRNWRETLLVLPLRQTDSHLFFNEIQEVYTTGHLTGNLSIPLYFQGIYLHAFDQIINQLLNRDTFWLCMSLTSLLILLGLWTQSLVVPFVTLMSISWSLLIAYTIYGKLLQIPHFPIINLLTIVLAIGLGADDLLIFRQTWIQNRIRYEHLPPDQVELDDIEVIGNDNRSSDSLSLSPCPVSNLGTNTVENDVSQDLVKNPSSHLNRTLEQLKIDQIYCTLLHAVPPMTLTTMSTLSGLFMNFCSSILAIQRFAIYSCLVIMCNYVFIICIIPSWFLISQSDLGLFWKRFANIRRRCHDLGENINPFKMFAKIVIYLRILCPILYAILVFFSIHQLIWLRKFDLPNHTNNSSNTVNLISSIGGSSTFLNSHHPFELFVHKHSQLFWVERNLHYYQNLIQINFVWGPLPKDERSLFNYNHDDPVKVLLTFDPDLNLISNLARQWLGKFCNELKQMPYLFKPISFGYNQYMMDSFKLSNLNPILSQPIWCPLGRFVNSLDNYVIAQPCYQNQSTSVCCLNGKHLDIYNDSSELFLPCLYEYFSLDSSESYTGYRFYQTRKELSNPVGFVTTVLTNISMILNTHVQITSYLDELNIWFNNQLSTAPKSLSKGFMFAPGLNHYEITTNVTNNVYWSSLVAIIIATFLILLCSLNIILACLAFFALSGCLLFSINLLTFIDGWSLGVIEGLVINLAAGLAIDPCIHLAWYLSKTMHKFNLNRDSQGTLSYTSSFIQTSLVHFGPAITGSAWTTALAGVPMLFSNLVCYHQIGAFLVCLMLSSWLFCFVLFAGTLACCDCIFFKRMFK